jgi:hypothetical protein
MVINHFCAFLSFLLDSDQVKTLSEDLPEERELEIRDHHLYSFNGIIRKQYHQLHRPGLEVHSVCSLEEALHGNPERLLHQGSENH